MPPTSVIQRKERSRGSLASFDIDPAVVAEDDVDAATLNMYIYSPWALYMCVLPVDVSDLAGRRRAAPLRRQYCSCTT